jgi:hypothetical protein
MFLGWRVRTCFLLLDFKLWTILGEELEVFFHFVLEELNLLVDLDASTWHWFLV